jgi:hypothetical protein
MTPGLARSNSDARAVVIVVRQVMLFIDMAAILDPSRPARDEAILTARVANSAA